MAPPKPTTPSTTNPSSDDHSISNKSGAGGGGSAEKKKTKVTPVQVAFLVERYLADSGFSASLAAFRSDAAHLFAKTATFVPPKGLLPLADILHDYIALKEARLAVDSAMQAMHGLVSNYYLHHHSHPHSAASPPGQSPSSPPLVPPLFVAPNASSPPHLTLPPPPGTAGYASPMIYYNQTSSVVQNSLVNNMSTPATSSLHTKKRKATKTAGKTTSASKKTCTAPTTTSHPQGKTVASQPPIDNQEQNMGSATQPSSAEHSVVVKLPVQGSTVAKTLFKPHRSQVHSSPCTPRQSHTIADESIAYQTERSSSVVVNAHTQQEIASSQCSIVSSKTLIVSPLKGASYYAVERSYHVSSPVKSSSQKSSRREHVKGKLDFGSSDARSGSTEQICEKASTSVGEKQDDFDIDFTDIFDGDFSFSELLHDFDLDTEDVLCQNTSTNSEDQRLEPITNSNYMTADPFLPHPIKPLGAEPTEDNHLQGATSVTSVRAITKRIKIVSPVKSRAAS